MKEFKVGDLVQKIKDNSIMDGQVTELVGEKFLVSWTDGSSSEEDCYRLSNRDSLFEREFRLEAMKRLKEIDEHLGNACRELDAAVNISEKYGIPFSTNISFISQNYNPKSRSKKYPDLDSDFLESVTGTYGSEDDYGWQHSAVCY